MNYNIINCTEADLNNLYEENALTFEGTTITEDNLTWLVNWLKDHNCEMKHYDFYVIAGKLMNDFYELTGDNAYPESLTILTIKLSDLTNVGAICIPRFELGGRWFNDVVDNNAMREKNNLEKNHTTSEITFFVYSGRVEEGEKVTFEVRDRFEYKTIERKIYFDKHDGLYINYKGKRYFESEFVYN